MVKVGVSSGLMGSSTCGPIMPGGTSMLDTSKAKDFQVGLLQNRLLKSQRAIKERSAARACSYDVVSACSLQTQEGTQLIVCIIELERLMKEGCISSNMCPWTGHASVPFSACFSNLFLSAQMNQRRKKLT
jgi:hypothetical protein